MARARPGVAMSTPGLCWARASACTSMGTPPWTAQETTPKSRRTFEAACGEWEPKGGYARYCVGAQAPPRFALAALGACWQGGKSQFGRRCTVVRKRAFWT